MPLANKTAETVTDDSPEIIYKSNCKSRLTEIEDGKGFESKNVEEVRTKNQER